MDILLPVNLHHTPKYFQTVLGLPNTTKHIGQTIANRIEHESQRRGKEQKTHLGIRKKHRIKVLVRQLVGKTLTGAAAPRGQAAKVYLSNCAVG